MSYILPHLQAMFEIPMTTLYLLVIMCAVAMYFIRPHLAVSAMVLVLGPISLFLSAAANYALTKLEYFALNKTDQWLICTIAAATIGNIITLVCAAALAHALDRKQARRSRFHRA